MRIALEVPQIRWLAAEFCLHGCYGKIERPAPVSCTLEERVGVEKLDL